MAKCETRKNAWFYEWLEGYESVMFPLFADLQSAANGLYLVDHVFWRRIYIRSLFATVEADIFQRKQLALAGHAVNATFDERELTILREVQYNVANNGAISESPRFIPLATNYRLSFQFAGRVINTRFQLDVGGESWREFLQCIEIRNGITHPKNPSDLEISNAGAEIAERVSSWCRENGIQFFLEAIADS